MHECKPTFNNFQIKCITLLLFLWNPSITFAQQGPDSTRKALIESLHRMLKEEAGKSVVKYKENRISANQDVLLEEMLKTIRAAREYLKAGVDTTHVIQELEDIKLKYEIAGDGIFTNKGSLQTERNLTTSYKLLHELLSRAKSRKVQIDNYKRKLTGFRNEFDSLSSSPNLYAISTDTTEFNEFLRKLVVAAREISPIDSVLKQTIRNVQHTKDRVDLTVYMLQSSMEQIDAYEKQLFNETFEREVSSLASPPLSSRPFHEIVRQSIEKGKLSFLFYARNNVGRIFLLLLLIGFAIVFLKALKKKVKGHGLLRDDFSDQLVLRYPVLSAVMIVLNVFQFIFPNPPFIFSCILWVIASVCLSVIFLRFITRYWMLFWVFMWCLFLLACGDNLILQASRTERYLMLGLSAAGLLVSAFVLLRGEKAELKERSIIYFISFIIILEIAAIVANVSGRFNLAKALMAGGFISVIIAIMFLWTVRLINEGLSLASDIYQRPERKLFFINFAVIGKRAPVFFYIFLIVGWFILFARNFYAFRFISEPIEDLLFDQRQVGAYTFSFFSVLAFFAILILSTIISKIVSFFATESPGTHAENANARKPGIGSWILLVRISIIIMGLLLAFAIAGIPLDRATFVLGALGVGIGFGLQALVNNLVSGVIIAFEKPLNVGDLVEVRGKTGTVESIGFRSSVLQTLEGSHLVIPNGEILNQELVNWSMNKSMRRNEILVGVAYDTDLKVAHQLLMNLLQANEHILKYPEPAVFANNFGASSIELQLFFWTLGLKGGKVVKSELIFAIQEAFRENNITIPFPQQDVYIRGGKTDMEEAD